MPDFDAALARLNDAQRAAVETIEGPVMCIAGPGTGKTQVVAMRVANILQKTQMRPGNILCLTFSMSGATAMRQRLRSLIGSDAYGVSVNTIHGFCNDLIGQHPQVFEAWSALEQISDVERYRVVNMIIDDLMPDIEIVNKKSPYGRTKEIIDRISQVKREGKTSKELWQAVERYQQEMETKSKPGTKVHERNLLSARKFEDFAKIFDKHQLLLQQSQRYDYEDMILTVIRAMESEEWLTAGLQEKYQYILVDEFQDTNGSQYRVIELLTTYASVDQAPNLFIVGDDDQAIYRFQGANLQNILKFHQRFPAAPIIVLSTSYRSTQPILDAAGRLIAKNTERLVGTLPSLRKDMKSAKEEQGIEPMLLSAPSDAVEPWLVAQLVQDRIAQGIEPGEIAVLTQTNSELLRFYEAMRASGIPVQMEGKVDLLTHPLVRQTLCILKAVQDLYSTPALVDALYCACCDCHAADIGRLNVLQRQSKKPMIEILLEIDIPGTPSAALILAKKSHLIRIRDVLIELSGQLASRTVVDTLERLLKGVGLIPDDASRFTALDPVDFAAVQAFFDRVRYRAYEQPQFSFCTLLHDLEMYENPDNGGLRMSFSVPHIIQNGVRLLTAHQSKGLEFETVMLVNFRESHWDKRRNPSGLSIPEDLLFGWQKDQKSFEQNQDERRVAYVAMTRAKSELIFTCPVEITTGDKARQVSPSGFFAEAGPLPERAGEIRHPERVSTLLLPVIRSIDDEFKTFLRHRLETFALSVTALNHFLEDPQLFLTMDLLHTPSKKSVSLIYGNAVHAALKKWGFGLQEGPPLTRELFLDEFRNYLVERELTTEKERKGLLAVGEQALTRYFDDRLSSLSPYVHKVEYSLKGHLGEIPIKGMLDRLDLDHPDSARATVTDYKTGRPQTDSEIRDGDYYRQLVFYALLLESARGDLQPHAFILEFIGEGAEHPVERRFDIPEQDKKELSRVIDAVWAKIQALDFTPL